ncbi:hypothetical protein [sulfur-oxidizing endosymbiont of Gigantopelta aegis]|uniref:hypothetical protein n=1 Tax=sulfur-oxidizing endosymbiont of Gigantopelta aegis TaxID=2794934 RepID=UPI001FE73F8C|nr:hypothetical protein [sulfur-oxidizing endosymbiont of Gigantopelta aegis]
MNLLKNGMTTILQALVLTMLLTFSSLATAQEVNINTADAQTIAASLNGIGLKKRKRLLPGALKMVISRIWPA